MVETDGNVRLILKDWPIFGDTSVFDSQAVLGAAQIGKYEAELEALMKIKGKLTNKHVESQLTKAGLSMTDLVAAVNTHKHGPPTCLTGTTIRRWPSVSSARRAKL